MSKMEVNIVYLWFGAVDALDDCDDNGLLHGDSLELKRFSSERSIPLYGLVLFAGLLALFGLRKL